MTGQLIRRLTDAPLWIQTTKDGLRTFLPRRARAMGGDGEGQSVFVEAGLYRSNRHSLGDLPHGGGIGSKCSSPYSLAKSGVWEKVFKVLAPSGNEYA